MGAGHDDALAGREWDGEVCYTGTECRGGFFDGLSRFSTEKEPHFFDIEARHELGLGYYTSAFPACEPAPVAALDCSPYSTSDDAPAVFAALWPPPLLPRTTVAMLLCEPIRRAHSFFYWKRMDRPEKEGVPFGEWVALLRARGHFERVRSGWESREGIWKLGRYSTSARRWLEVAGHLVIISAPRFYRDPGLVVEELLGVWQARSGKPLPVSSAVAAPDGAAHSVSGSSVGGSDGDVASAPSPPPPPPPPPPRLNSRSHPRLEDEVTAPADRQALSSVYARSNQELYDLISRDDVAARAEGVDQQITFVPNAARGSRFLETKW